MPQRKPKLETLQEDEVDDEDKVQGMVSIAAVIINRP